LLLRACKAFLTFSAALVDVVVGLDFASIEYGTDCLMKFGHIARKYVEPLYAKVSHSHSSAS